VSGTAEALDFKRGHRGNQPSPRGREAIPPIDLAVYQREIVAAKQIEN
jgi:hypothetical protein